MSLQIPCILHTGEAAASSQASGQHADQAPSCRLAGLARFLIALRVQGIPGTKQGSPGSCCAP